MCDRTTSLIEPGDGVIIVGNSTFSSMRGVCLRSLPGGQVQVQLTIFGRPVAVDLDPDELSHLALPEQEYLTSCHTPSLIRQLARWDDIAGGMARRVSLFRCAVLRLVWEQIPPGLRPFVETAEWLADRPRARTRREIARRQIEHWRSEELGPEQKIDSPVANLLAAFGEEESLWDAWTRTRPLKLPPGVCSAQLLREFFGNPYRPPRIDPAWLAWQSGAVRRLADDIYEQRRFGELPVLADALEDAGCDDETILSHLRTSSPHFRGCWALDAVLGHS
jgi:hypothetical protein